jgi:hypothetical protein
MARPRKHATEAEKQAAYRERKALAEGAKSAQPAPGQAPAEAPQEESIEELFAGPNGAPRARELPAAGAGEKLPAPVTARPAPPLEEYVAGEIAITRAQLELRPDLDDHKGRLERTEKYARWRYAGYLAGEVQSL